MNSISDFANEKLKLVQPAKFKRIFELTSLKGVIQKITFSGVLRSSAVIDDFNTRWEIKPSSWWTNNLAVYKEGYEIPITNYTSNFFRTKGSIDLGRGESLIFKFNWFTRSLRVFNLTEILLLSYSYKMGFLKTDFSVTIMQESELLDENPYVLMLGFFIFIENINRGKSA